jgi:hypothetical protein
MIIMKREGFKVSFFYLPRIIFSLPSSLQKYRSIVSLRVRNVASFIPNRLPYHFSSLEWEGFNKFFCKMIPSLLVAFSFRTPFFFGQREHGASPNRLFSRWPSLHHYFNQIFEVI